VDPVHMGRHDFHPRHYFFINNAVVGDKPAFVMFAR
jgi:hypothetical protein